jgi:membrane protease YdiL (CAAX protease family)|tara:strand:- start:685 stop:1194 length:510 start_codon:yes stop_codon:yes gene_type:complete
MMGKILRWIKEAIVNVFALRKPKLIDLFLSVLVSAAAAAGATLLLNFLIDYFPTKIPEGLESVNELLSTGGGVVLTSFIFAVVIVAPVVEEILFRGILWRAIEKMTSTNVAWAVTSVLFAAAHADIIHIIAVFPLGVLFGYLRKRTNNIWAPMIAHATNNLLASLTLIF